MSTAYKTEAGPVDKHIIEFLYSKVALINMGHFLNLTLYSCFLPT